MHTSHSTRTTHAHTRQQRSAAAHSHSADTLVASPATQVHQFETQELCITDLLVCSEADKERRSSTTQTPTHTGLMTGPLIPPPQRLRNRQLDPKCRREDPPPDPPRTHPGPTPGPTPGPAGNKKNVLTTDYLSL
jgi:hypothetical protein